MTSSTVRLLLATACAALAGCASLPDGVQRVLGARVAPVPAPPAASPGGASARNGVTLPPGAPAPPLAAGAPPPFANVVKDASSTEGLFTLWRRDDKVWIELRPEQLNRPYFLSPKQATGLGEGGLYAGAMATGPRIVEFRRLHGIVQLIAPNQAYTAAAGTPIARAVQASFSPSLVASAAIASQPHPQRQSILVEANALFLGDLLGIGPQLERSYRQSYGFDSRNSAITAARATPDAVNLEVLSHFASSRLAQPQPGSLAAPGAPTTLPDARSLFITVHIALAKLPDEPMRPRRADPRVGYFQSVRSDFSDDLSRTPRERYVNRWRLEKKEPSAAVSEPVRPITFWLDRNIPEKYRGAIEAGILEWNKAFERIGFRDAVRVRVQPDDAEFDTLDVDHASVRWVTSVAPRFVAIGPRHVDPRSGEILDADIAIESLYFRSRRTERSQVLNTAGTRTPAEHAFGHVHPEPGACEFADAAAEQLDYALDVLEARGDLDPAGPEAEAFVQGYLKLTTMHEVGHALGLRHNFRASRVYDEAQLSDPEFTAHEPTAGSAMEYTPVNLAAPGHAAVTPFQTTLGPYDYWAIEYGYRPLAPGEEAAELARIAARSAEPQLAYGTDEDNTLGIDPDSLLFDLGSDIVAFARKRIAIARELIERQETRELPSDGAYAVLRRSINYALNDLGRTTALLARQIGGVRTLRDAPGSGRDPLQPVPAAQQRAALEMLSRNLLAADSIRLSPALQRRLAPDYAERTDAYFSGDGTLATDYSLSGALIELQRGVLSQLMSDAVAVRLIDSQAKSSRGGEALTLAELYERLQRDVWSELERGGDIGAARRELQREHLNRVAGLLLQPGSYSRADARSLVRRQARALLVRLQAALRRPGLGPEARAHLADSADTLSQALSARLERAGA